MRASISSEEENSSIDYEGMTVPELRDLAKERELTGYSALTKAELIKLLQESEA